MLEGSEIALGVGVKYAKFIRDLRGGGERWAQILKSNGLWIK